MVSNQALTLKGTISTALGAGGTFLVYETGLDLTKASVVFKNAVQLERMQLNIATDGTCTIVMRGLTNGTTKVEDANLKKEWGNGAKGYVTVLASDLLDVDNTGDKQILDGDFEFLDNVEVDQTLTAKGTFTVTGKSKPYPEFANETARDDFYTAPVNGNKATVNGNDCTYNGTTGQWEYFGISTPLPDATTVMKGKARLATQAEVLAGTVSDAIVTPATLAGKEVNSFVITSDYPLGEPVTDIAKSCLFKETAPTFAQASTAQNIGDVAGNTRVSFPAICTGVASNSLKLSLAKNGSPSAFLRARIETDNAGSPSGTLVDPNATKDIDPATLTTSLADTTVTFPASITIANGTKVHTVVSAVGDVVNASNYYKIGYSTNDMSTRAAKTYDGTNWVSIHTYNNITDTNTAPIAQSNGTSGYFYLTPKKNIYLKTISTVASVTNVNISGGGYNLNIVPSGNLATFNIVLLNNVTYTVTWSGTSTTYYSGTWTSSNTNVTVSGQTTMYTGFTIISSDYFIGNTTFPYISSTLFHNTVLSLTDSDFAYKVDLYGIATATGAVGSFPKVYLPVDGAIVPNFTGMTIDSTQYLSGTPGGISSTSGTYTIPVGIPRYTNLLKLVDQSDYFVIGASDDVIKSLDTVKTTSSTTNVLLKRNIIDKSGIYRVKFDMKTNSGTYGAYATIYKNGAAATGEFTDSDTTYTTYSSDIPLKKGDSVELYVRAQSGGTGTSIQNFRLCGTVSPLSILN